MTRRTIIFSLTLFLINLLIALLLFALCVRIAGAREHPAASSYIPSISWWER